MKPKSVISGAMMVAAGVSAATDRVAARESEPEKSAIKATAEGLKVDLVRIDDDVLVLGGLGAETDSIGVHGATSGFWNESEELYLAQTVYGGDPDKPVAKPGKKPRVPKTKVPGTRAVVVINPSDNKSQTILFHDKKRAYFDPDDGKQFTPPDWMRRQVEK